MDVKKTFIAGRMNKDDDERLLQDGEYRHAENIQVINSEGSDVGAIENYKGNRRLTNIDFGTNPITITPNLCVNKTRNKIYWMVASDTGSFLVEYDRNNNFSTIVLKDTRPLNERVFNLNPKFLITGIDILIGETEEEDLLLWTDDNMEPCCINIERAKTYGENGFTKEDIYLIKKPPKYAPKAIQINSSEPSNYLEEKFFSFGYRYQYLDREYSAISSYTHYVFTPNDFKIDFITGENLGMVNKFNSVRLFFDTGEKQVVSIEIVAKASNSNTLYKIASYEKKLEGWGHNEERSITFNNNKIYTILSESEYLRQYDNVPLKAKSLALIGNRLVLGDYTEGFDMIDLYGNKIKANILTSFVEKNTEGEELFYFTLDDTISGDEIVLPGTDTDSNVILINRGDSLVFQIELIESQYDSTFSSEFIFLATKNFQSFNEIANDPDFIVFVENVMTQAFNNTISITDLPPGSTVDGLNRGFKIKVNTQNQINILAPVLNIDTGVNTELLRYIFFFTTKIIHKNSNNITTLKSNRDYEAGIVYKDEFQRSSTVITSQNNSVFIPLENSITQNKIRVRINHLPPSWAKTYKLAIKAQPLSYQIIFVNQFFKDGPFVWIKLEGENKDKVKEGDILILKRDRLGPTTDIIKTKVLEAEVKEKNFIIDNTTSDGIEINEPQGFYVKIKPSGFLMNYDPDEFFESESFSKRYAGQPISYTDLFSIEDENVQGQFSDRPLAPGSIINFYFKSKRRNRKDQIYEKQFVVETEYQSFEDWFQDVVSGTNIEANNGAIYEDVSIVKGFVETLENPTETIDFFTPNPNGKLFLKVKGIYGGNANNRRGFLDVKVSLRNVNGVFIFETETKNTEQEFFFESEETFEIINNAHQGNIQNQDEPLPSQDSIIEPAIIETNFFNAYSFGNGAESYQVKDSQLKESLNIDLKPTIVTVDEYKQIRRFADVSYGGPYNEGFNSINEFLIKNFYQLDKQYGSIQKLFSRDTNLLIFQEFKTSYVLFQKNTITTATGVDIITRDTNIFGDQVPYLGDNGIGRKPESFTSDDFRIYFVNPNRGTPVRLSMDGTEEINTKMVNWFREEFLNNPFGKAIGAYDSHTKQFMLSFKEGINPVIIAKIGVPLMFNDLLETSYQVIVDEIYENITINYKVEKEEITITTSFEGIETRHEKLSGEGNIVVETQKKGILNVLIESENPNSFIINHFKSEPPSLKIKLLTIGDDFVAKKSVTNQYTWAGAPSIYSENIYFDLIPLVFYKEITGKEGVNQIPKNGREIELSSFKSENDNIDLNENCLIGYLVSDTEYTLSDIQQITENATFLSLTTHYLTANTLIKKGKFIFDRVSEDDILYLIWDYRKINNK